MEQIIRYFPGLSPLQKNQFKQLLPFYKEWNSKINVISRKDIENLYEHHVLHSLAIAKVIQFKAGTQVVDIGTGGGFPGIPLAILFPEVSFHLVDSIGKKINVVNAIASALNLQNVSSEKARAEALDGKYDFVISRAVTRLPEFYSLVSSLIKSSANNSLPNGILYLKGGEIKNERIQFEPNISVYKLADFFSEEFFQTKMLVHIFQK